MVRGTRSGRAGSSQSHSHTEETTNGGDMGMMIDSEIASGLKRKSPEVSTHLTPSPAKRTRSSISKGLNSVSPVQQTKTGVDPAAPSSVPGPRFDTAVDPNSTSGTASGAGATSGTGAATGNGTGRRVRTRNKPNPALVSLNANGNNGTTGDKSAGKGESERDGLGSKEKGHGAFVMDLSEDEDKVEGDQEMEIEMGGSSGTGRILGRKKRGEILGVLVAMETPDHTYHDPHARSRTKMVKIVDLPFLLKSTSAKGGKAENDEGKGEVDSKVDSEAGNGVKREMDDTDVKKGKETTLKRFLMSKERVTVDGLLCALSDLAHTLLMTTNLPNPYNGLIAKSSLSTSTSSNPIPEPTTLSARLLGSKVKQEKELPVYEHLQAVKDVVLGLISSTASTEGKDVLPTPKSKYRWALHQRTTVPWPMPPRPAARGEKQPTPVIPTDRVHLDWFTSVAATENGKMEQLDAKVVESLKEQGGEEEEDLGGLTRLQTEGYLALGRPIVIGPPDRHDEEAQRARGPKLGKTLYADASKKLQRYKEKRRGKLPIGKPVGFLTHYHSFIPSFAPTYDSTMVSGGWNYNDTVDAARAAAINREWIESGWNSNYASTSVIKLVEPIDDDVEAHERALRAAKVLMGDEIPDSAIDPELLGAIEQEQSGSQTAKNKLRENAELLLTLAQRQEVRLRRDEREITDPEEHALASRVSANLLELASNVRPRSILPRRRNPHLPLAAELAQTAVSTSGAIYRGTLDPARPKAMAENYVVHTRDEPVGAKRREAPATPAVTPNRSILPNATVARAPPQPMMTPTPPVRHTSSFNGAIPPYRGGVPT